MSLTLLSLSALPPFSVPLNTCVTFLFLQTFKDGKGMEGHYCKNVFITMCIIFLCGYVRHRSLALNSLLNIYT
jgi:hypothetical protein